MQTELFISALYTIVLVWVIILLVRKWSRLCQWAKVVYVVLIFSGLGPFLVLGLLIAEIGFKSRDQEE